ncbi:MAG: hypothetical protein M3Y53_06370 [Thermoproteota archaeon]|nr:hypothetical protein [Thermoproteota archaeon]
MIGELPASLVDVPLMLSISSATATFVTILAGFYTTKIISISNEKRRICMKIKEIELELDSRKKYVAVLTSRMGEIRNACDQDLIESFEKYVA